MTSALLASLITLVLVLICILCYVYVGFVLFDTNNVSNNDGRSASSSSISPSSSFSFNRNYEETNAESNGPIVSTITGKIEGVYLDVLGKRIEAYFGIPYATPPTGNLRFARTAPIIKWRKTFKAIKQSPICPQFKSPDIDLPWVGNDGKIEESEDCLKLNIWTPSSKISSNQTSHKPTIIWIHGGGFVSGHIRTKEFDGSVLAASTDSIVAMMNYRVGIFGFLNLNHPEIDGNQGMYDQVQAIKWIVSNVVSFGGDPSSITLMGESAGGASVGYHMISPLTRDLFHRAIIQSGSPLMPNSLVALDQIYAIGSEVTISLGCNKTSMNRMKGKRKKDEDGDSDDEDEIDDSVINCLKSKPIQELLSVQSRIIRRKDDTTFCPSFYDDFLPENPIDAMRNVESFGKVKKSVLIGFNKDEGSVFMYFSNPTKYPAVIDSRVSMSSDKISITSSETRKPTSNSNKRTTTTMKKVSRTSRSSPSSTLSPSSSSSSVVEEKDVSKTNLTLNEVINFATKFMKSQNPSTTKSLLNTLYSNVNESIPGNVFNETKRNVGEFFVICPEIFAANEFVNANISVYFYHFIHRPKSTPWKSWVGAAHYEEVQFVFGLPLISPSSSSSKYSKDEIKLSKKIMKSWTTFARYGQPYFSESIKWPTYKSSSSSLSTSTSPSSSVSISPSPRKNSNKDINEEEEMEKYVEISNKNMWKIKTKLPQEKCNFWKLTYEVTHSQAEKPDLESATKSSSMDHSDHNKDEESDEDEDKEKEKIVANKKKEDKKKLLEKKEESKKIEIEIERKKIDQKEKKDDDDEEDGDYEE